MTRAAILTFLLTLISTSIGAAQEPTVKILFLGDNAGHRPAERFQQIKSVLAKRGIDAVYTDKADALSPKVLAGFDGLVIYANIVKITPDQETALLDYVASGKGFIPIHCASYCFLNSPKYIELVGAQFKSHGSGTFRTTIVEPDHPVMKGFKGFESFDETYVHTKHNKDRTILEYREDGKGKEPWTWVRTHGKGRVFYTAWGHDQRTWSNPGFHDLVVRGIFWATQKGQPADEPRKNDPAVEPPPSRSAAREPFPIPEMTPKRTDVKPFKYEDVGNKIPNYKGGKGQTLNLMQLPVEAEESLKHLVVPKGFQAELVAADPHIRRPICMNWDEQGRLWIAESVDYPSKLGEGNDRLVICEDTDGDGKMDKFTVFADKLSIPSGFTFWKGGVVVFENKHTLFLKDSKGGDKADIRQVLFTGWGMNDTHACVSNMQYGLDNWIWAMQGYNQSKVTLGGETHSFRQGFFRFKPPLGEDGKKNNGGKLEFLRSTNNNTWGLGLSEEGLVFGSTANGNPSEYMPIPNRYYEAVKGWTPSLVLRGIAGNPKFKPATNKVRQVDFFGGYTAAAGHALYTAREYPQEYWNRAAFVNEPTGHLVGTFVLRPEGSHFTSTNPFNLAASDDEWTSPIMSEVGPDGNVWVIDWYSYIIQHNPTPPGFKTGPGAAYETDLRDKKHGRVYRIVSTPRGEVPRTPRVPQEKMTLKDASPEKLIETLKHSNMFWRKHAQRLLAERGKQDILPALFGLVRNHEMDAIGLNVGAIHALWTMHGLGALDGKNEDAIAVAQAALRHPSAGVRRNAVQVLPRTAASTEAVLAAGLTEDPDAQVRLATLLALADLPAAAKAGEAIAAVLNRAINTDDRWIPDAATSAAAKNSEHFLKALSDNAGGSPKAPNSKTLSVAGIVAEHYARGGPTDSVGGVLSKLADADPTLAETVVRGLAKGWPRSSTPKLTEAVDKDLVRLAARLSPEKRAVLVQLASSWGSKGFEKIAAEMPRLLLAKITDDKLKSEDRTAAARELLEFQPGDKKIVPTLLDLITPRTPPELAAGFLRALELSEVPQTGQLIVAKLPALTPASRAVAISVVLARPEWTAALLEQAETGKFLLTELSLDQKQALSVHPNADVKRRAVDLLKKGGVLPNADRQKVVEELLPITMAKGDAMAGKMVFKNVCAKCHVHSGVGERIGPDLTGMAVHTKEHLLIDIIDPSRSVEANFRIYQVTTTKGTIHSGMLASESKTAIELFDAEGKKTTILRESIDEMTASPKSLMPDGFEKLLKKEELTDLLEFLTQRGKYLPLPLDKVATAISTRGLFYEESSKIERLVFADWTPKVFEGVPFHLVDPQGDKVPNVIMLYGPQGKQPPKMPKSVSIPCNMPAKAIHLLSGVSGWGYPYGDSKGSVTMIVRLNYEDGKTEDHQLKNGEHFADYIRRVDVPGSKFAFNLGGKQIRYLSVQPKRSDKIARIELVKGPDDTAPIVMALTVEGLE